jgi:ABC-type hemin transport system ATPase subunit
MIPLGGRNSRSHPNMHRHGSSASITRRPVPAELSGGEQQRVAIARAIAKQLPLLRSDRIAKILSCQRSSRDLDDERIRVWVILDAADATIPAQFYAPGLRIGPSLT